MRVSGTWRLCDDNVARPTFFAEIKDASGAWVEIPFLADCGADRTVLSPDAFKALAFPQIPSSHAMAGVGGTTASFEFTSVMRVRRSDGAAIHFRGRLAAVSAPSLLDMSVLGRDITNLFALIVDRPGDTVCLLSRGEVYQA